MKICGFLQMFNELEKGNLERCISNMKIYCDYIAVYNDASTDNSKQFCINNACFVVNGKNNNFINETFNKQLLLEKTLKNYKDIDWFVWLDADEILDNNITYSLKEFLSTAEADGYSMIERNLWRSECWERLDYPGRNKFVRLWRNIEGLTFNIENGLHKQLYPINLGKIIHTNFNVIHYGYSTQYLIERRWRERNAMGISKTFCNRQRQFDETNMKLERMPNALFPPDNKPKNIQKPIPTKWNVEF